MKKAKRTISILLIAIMLMSSMVTYADTTIGEKALDMLKNQLEVMRLQAQNVQTFVAIIKDLVPLMLQKFKDVKESDWYRDNLALLFGMNIIEGDGKGNFLPNKEVSASEFLKMVIVAVDNKTYAAAPNESWDEPYIRRAKELGLVKQGDIGLYTSPLNRYQMARIIVRACKEQFDDISQYRSSLKDYERMPAEYEDYVLKAYSKGIINGLPDGTFGGDNTMKRAEATAVIARLIDPSQRKTPQKPVVDTTKPNLKSPEMQELVKNVSELVNPVKNTGDIVFYAEAGNATFGRNDLYVGADTDIIHLVLKNYSDKTLTKAKEILQHFYPTKYEEAYNELKNTIDTGKSYKETIIDNKTVAIYKFDTATSVHIGKEVKK